MLESAVTPICPKCKSKRSSRIKRAGLLQRYLLQLFGYFPWRCNACGTRYIVRSRGSSRTQGGAETAVIPLPHSKPAPERKGNAA